MILIAVERTTMRANTQTMIRYFTCSVLTVDLGCPSFSAIVMNSLPLCSKKKKSKNIHKQIFADHEGSTNEKVAVVAKAAFATFSLRSVESAVRTH